LRLSLFDFFSERKVYAQEDLSTANPPAPSCPRLPQAYGNR
jgi:hypothetical protein